MKEPPPPGPVRHTNAVQSPRLTQAKQQLCKKTSTNQLPSVMAVVLRHINDREGYTSLVLNSAQCCTTVMLQ